MPLDLDDTDKAALVEVLRQTIATDPFPLSPRIRRLRSILDKLAPPPPRPEPYPAPKPAGEPSMVLAKKNAAPALTADQNWLTGQVGSVPLRFVARRARRLLAVVLARGPLLRVAACKTAQG